MLRLKLVSITAIFVCLLSLSSAAQPRNSARFSAIESEKIAYITKELKLTPAEAQKFFPLYNQYNKEMWDIKSAKTGMSQAPQQHVNSLNRRGSRDVIAYDAKEVEIKKEYRKKFSQVIGESRASQFFEVEQRFRENLIKELRSRRNK